MTRKVVKSSLSLLLTAALGITSISLPVATKNASADDAAKPTVNVDSLLQVKVDDGSAKSMKLYSNGVFEAAEEMAAGTHKVSLLVDGVEADTADITLSDKQTVYLRGKDGDLTDSVNDKDKGFYSSATLVGGFTSDLKFKKGFSLDNWKQDDPNGDIAYVGGGIYQETFEIEELSADYTVDYKVAFDHAWDYNYGKDGAVNGDNISLTIPAGTTKFSVFVDSLNEKLGDSINDKGYELAQSDGTAYQAKAYEMSVSLIGPVREDGDGDWDAAKTGYEFTQIGKDLYLYSKVFAKAGGYSYKAVFDYAKWYEQEADNKTFIIRENGQNVVFLYNAADGYLYDSVASAGKVAELLGMKEAAVASEVTTNDDGTMKFVLATGVKEGDIVKVVYQPVTKNEDGTYSFAKDSASKTVDLKAGTNSQGAFNNSFVADNVSVGAEAATLAYYYTVNDKEYNDPSATLIKVDGKDMGVYEKAAFAGRKVYVPGTLPGESWNAASNQMTYLGNDLYSYTFKDVPAANYEFKIAIGGSWDENYGEGGLKDGPNIMLAVDKTQDVTIYYNDKTHLAVTNLTYKFAEVTLSGTGIPADTKLEDAGLTGIYSTSVDMKAGEYKDVKYTCEGKEYVYDAFTLSADKKVTFYFDPNTEIYYNDSSDKTVDGDKVYYNSKETAYKSTYGAVATGSKTTFTIATGTDVTAAKMVVKGPEPKNLDMTKKEAADGLNWSVDVSFDTIGQYTYFFVLYAGTSVKIYGDDDGYYGEGKVTDLTDLQAYDLIVYKNGYHTSEWMKNAVVYQIFPDRFYNADTSNDEAQTYARGTNYEFVKDWYMIPENPEQEELNPDSYPSNAFRGDGDWGNEIYGGDLKGVTERIDYLKALGVNVIYLNPVFSSISNHRYDASDYSKIDPILGTLGDFQDLVAVAKKNDMHIILDGVFNHVADDSIYFDRYYRHMGENGTVGAYPYWAYVYDYMSDNNADKDAAVAAAKTYFKDTYNVTDFSYTEWFEVKQTYMDGDVKDSIGLRAGKPVYAYDCWWGYDNMPVIYSTKGSEYQTGNWGERIIGDTPNNKDASDSITQYWLSQGSNGWRLDVANEVSDETWQHFRNSVKALDSDNVIIGEIWTDAVQYLLGDMYDSVMNYVFRGAVLNFAKGGSATDMKKTLEKIRERYPEEAFYAMMNLVDSHDTSRVLSYLDGIDDDRNQKDLESAFPSYEKTSDTAKARQYLVAFLQMTYAGAPTIYYGDEMGQVGADDPDDRRTAPWGRGNEELVSWYAKMAAIRNSYSALRTGALEYIDTKNDAVVGYIRSDADSKLIVLGNNAATATEVTIKADGDKLTDLVLGKEYTVADGSLTVSVPAYSGMVLTKDAKTITVDKAALAPAYDPAYDVSAGQNNQSLAAVTGLTAKAAGSASVKLSWKAAAGATGYEVYRSTSKSKGYQKVATVTATSTTDKKLKAGKTYYYKVRAITDTAMGSFSGVKSAKTVAKTSIQKVVSKKKGTVTVTWKKASGNGYIIYTSSKKNGTYKKAKTVSKGTSATIKAKAGSKCYVKVAVYNTVSKKKVAGAKSAAKVVSVKK